ncbi:MAG: restriction endonuclease subunit S [Fusobacteriaceae bacterium]
MEELKEGWERVELGEVAKYINTKISTTKLSEKNYISTENMISNKGGITLSSNIPQNINVNQFNKNDILFSNIRTYFKKLWKAEFNGGASNDVLILRSLDSKKIVNEYLYYILSQEFFFDYTVNTSKGTKMPRGDKNAIMKYEFLIPENIETQQKIASILSSLDDKIELNNEMNKTLEEMAQTLFKRWFIDFEFPNENGELYRSSGGKMIESELGEIPEEWEVSNLGDLFKFIKGKKPKIVSEIFSDETPLKYLTIKGFNGDENLYASLERTILIDKKDIVMVMDGASSGDVYIGKYGVLGSTFSKIEKTKEINWSYIYLILKYYENDIKSHTTGSAIPHTDKGYVEKIKVSLPNNLELLNILSKEISETIKKNLINKEKIQSLTKLRDTLLPKLMSGEVEV